MTRQITRKLGFSRKLVLSMVGIAALAMPVILGLAHAAQVHAQVATENPSRGIVGKKPISQTPPISRSQAASNNEQLTNRSVTAPSFDVISFKHSGNFMNSSVVKNGRRYYQLPVKLQYKGLRLSGKTSLAEIIRFAFLNLVNPWQVEGPSWTNNGEEFYTIDARAPAGTTLDGAREMLRTALAERWALKYHFINKETPIYALVRGEGPLKLTPATDNESGVGDEVGPGRMLAKSAPLSYFAGFLSIMTDRQVFDRTGIQGRFVFDVNWKNDVQDGPGPYTYIARTGVERLGLKLEARKEQLKVLFIDSMNKEPTPD